MQFIFILLSQQINYNLTKFLSLHPIKNLLGVIPINAIVINHLVPNSDFEGLAC